MDYFQDKDPVMTVSSNLKPFKQCVITADKTRGDILRFRSTTFCRESNVFGVLCATTVRMHLERFAEAWKPDLKNTNCSEKCTSWPPICWPAEGTEAMMKDSTSFEFSLSDADSVARI